MICRAIAPTRPLWTSPPATRTFHAARQTQARREAAASAADELLRGQPRPVLLPRAGGSHLRPGRVRRAMDATVRPRCRPPRRHRGVVPTRRADHCPDHGRPGASTLPIPQGRGRSVRGRDGLGSPLYGDGRSHPSDGVWLEETRLRPCRRMASRMRWRPSCDHCGHFPARVSAR